jgi:hypothetical protein
MGFEPMNTGFADQRVSHFATGACDGPVLLISDEGAGPSITHSIYFGCAAVRI